MKATGIGFVLNEYKQMLAKWDGLGKSPSHRMHAQRTSLGEVIKSGFVLVCITLLFTSGCSTPNGIFKKTDVDGSSKATQLKPGKQELQRQISSLNAKLNEEKVARESLTRRLEIAQAAREDAIREVVRIRARIQDMASQAEASAMFAEARVILDRMENEAFNEEALGELDLARSYMARGKGALDSGNPGGAAYLFDLIPGVYEGMKKTDPRTIKIRVSIAILRISPTPSSEKVSS
ncbi:hypothetical protein MUP29_01980, partial [bacterium]|nr:hypothetical protein [bacterium]